MSFVTDAERRHTSEPQGGGLFIFCRTGTARAAYVAAGILARGFGWQLECCFDHIRQKRPVQRTPHLDRLLAATGECLTEQGRSLAEHRSLPAHRASWHPRWCVGPGRCTGLGP